MTQCVPSLDVEDNSSDPGRLKAAFNSNSMSSNLDVPTLDYEVAELTWKNGQLAMHGLGPPRMVFKSHPVDTASPTKYTWDKPHAAETLEAIVDQATLQPHHKPTTNLYPNDLVPWLDYNSSAKAVASGTISASTATTMDALVPGSATQPPLALLSGTNGGRAGCSTRVGSCSSDKSGFVCGGVTVPTVNDWSSCRDQSVSGNETFGMESSRQMTGETRERELGAKGFTSTSTGSPETTFSGKRSAKSMSPDEHDSACHSRPQKNESEEKKKGKGKSSISTKRSRAAAIHNQSERRRRDKINEKMKTLQKLIPNANKTDKASMLDEVIEYLKQLQAQIHMMGRMNMSPMMMPLAMQQQQLQMAMMNPMGMGMGMGMGMTMPGVMDLNAIGGNHPNMPAMPPVFHPSTFMQPMMASWDMHTTGDRAQNLNDQMATFIASQSQQPMTMEAYSRMAALFQQMQNQPCFSSCLKN